MKLKSVAVIFLATTGVLLQGRQAAAPISKLAREQITLANDALVMLRRLARDGRASFSGPSLSLWEGRKMEALRKSGAGKAEIIEAIEGMIKDLKEDEARAKGMLDGARGTMVEVYDVQYRRLEAEMWLDEERAK